MHQKSVEQNKFRSSADNYKHQVQSLFSTSWKKGCLKFQLHSRQICSLLKKEFYACLVRRIIVNHKINCTCANMCNQLHLTNYEYIWIKGENMSTSNYFMFLLLTKIEALWNNFCFLGFWERREVKLVGQSQIVQRAMCGYDQYSQHRSSPLLFTPHMYDLGGWLGLLPLQNMNGQKPS